jgi:hypothetical protein
MKLNRIAWLLTGIVTVWFAAVLLTGIVQAQQCDHRSDSFERFENIRLLPPAKITYFDGKIVEYVVQNVRETKAGKFEITADTTKENIKKGDLVWFVYCVKDNHLYVVSHVRPEQIKKQ